MSNCEAGDNGLIYINRMCLCGCGGDGGIRNNHVGSAACLTYAALSSFKIMMARRILITIDKNKPDAKYNGRDV